MEAAAAEAAANAETQLPGCDVEMGVSSSAAEESPEVQTQSGARTGLDSAVQAAAEAAAEAAAAADAEAETQLAPPEEEAPQGLRPAPAMVRPPQQRSRASELRRSETVAGAEDLIRSLTPDDHQMLRCTKAVGPTSGPSRHGAATHRPSVRKSDLDGRDASGLLHGDGGPGGARQERDEVRYVDPQQRQQQQSIRARVLDSDGQPIATGASSGPVPPAVSVDDAIGQLLRGGSGGGGGGGDDGGGGSGGGGGGGGLFSGVSQDDGGLFDFSQGQAQVDTLCICASDAAQMRKLEGLAKRMGAGVHLLREGGVAHPVPRECRAAIFDRAYLDGSAFEEDSYEALAIIAAGLRPLRPSYLEASVAQGDWADEHEHAWREENFDEDSPASVVLRSAARQCDRGERAFEGWRVALHPSALDSGESGHGLSQARASQADTFGKELQDLLRCGGAQLQLTDGEGEPIDPHFEPTHGVCGAEEVAARMRKPSLATAGFVWSTAESLCTLLHGTQVQDQEVSAYANDHPLASPALDAGPVPSGRGCAAASKPPSPTSTKKRRTRSGTSEPAAEVPAAKRRSRRSCAEGA